MDTDEDWHFGQSMGPPLQQENQKTQTTKLGSESTLLCSLSVFQRQLCKDGTARLKFINSQENNVYYIKYVLSGL